MKNFDVIVIGTGSAGATAAHKAKAEGLEVAIIDNLPFGGTCALRGCDPKKVLIGAADVLDWSERMQSSGVKGKLSIDWADLMKFKHSFTDPVPESRENSFKSAGIATYHGTASFVDQTTIDVDGEHFSASRNIVIATGALPTVLPIEGAEYLAPSDVFLNLTELPKKIVFVGGGYISFELAHLVARVGSKAVILHRGERPLEGFDADIVAKLMNKTEEIGIAVHLNAGVTAIEKNGDTYTVRTDNGEEITADLVVHGAGRTPALDLLNLEAGGVERDKHGVVVNEFFQSVSNEKVYAAGDVTLQKGGYPLTPIAHYEGDIAADNMLHGNSKTADYTGIPSVAFTVPAIAMVGMKEEEATEAGYVFSVHTGDTADWYSSRRVQEPHAMYKTLVDDKTGLILGAHLIGSHVEDTINLFALAIRQGITVEKFKAMMWAYPTHASDTGYMV